MSYLMLDAGLRICLAPAPLRETKCRREWDNVWSLVLHAVRCQQADRILDRADLEQHQHVVSDTHFAHNVSRMKMCTFVERDLAKSVNAERPIGTWLFERQSQTK